MSKQRTAVLYVRTRPEVRARLVEVAEAAGVTISDAADCIIGDALGFDAPQARLAHELSKRRDTPRP